MAKNVELFSSQDFEKLLEKYDKGFRKAFLAAVGLMQDNLTVAKLVKALADGNLDEVLSVIDKSAAILGNQYAAALTDAATVLAASISKETTVVVSFDQTNVRAVNAIRKNRLRLIKNLTTAQRKVIRQALSDSIAAGLGPREQAKAIYNVLGLTSRQNTAVNNYRKLLESIGSDEGGSASEALSRALRDGRSDRSVLRASQNNEPLTKAQIDSMVSRYRVNYIKHRAYTIARTESLRSAHQGTNELMRQAIEAGDFELAKVKRTWSTAKDEKVRGSHAALSGTVRLIGETFPGAAGPLEYPGDPNAPASEVINCRCSLAIRLDP